MPTVLIAGGTGGLGGAVTERFLAGGWRCVVPYADEPSALALKESVAAAPAAATDQSTTSAVDRLVLVEADLFDPDAVAAAVALADTSDSPLEAAVNLVGGFDAPGRVHETPIDRFEHQFRVNLRATYLVCWAALPGMVGRGAGSIVCVSSRAALQPFSGAAGYITAKAAVLSFVDAMASEYTADGVRVNAVVPSVIDTPANRASQPAADYSRWVSPREVAEVIAFLCSERSAPVAGAHVPVYGRA
jgi:NAD(P)-dependent dehydrogenase (short-subunit alcohol dehydrogenase family)